MSWSPAETWLFIAFLAVAAAFIAWAACVRHQDRRERPSRFASMTVDEAHMDDLRRLQAELSASYGVPSPLDPSGRVSKVGVDHWRCPGCGGLTYGPDPEALCWPCEETADDVQVDVRQEVGR